MAVDMFLKLTDIEGEAQDKTHEKEIDVLAWSWGMSQSGTFHAGGGGGSGKANFQDISITKYVDKASMTLMGKVATGEHIAEATLIVRKAGGKDPLELDGDYSEGVHLFPFRTEKLSPSALMVLP